jgi:ubiquinone/menaquinone biosynthesis C-methylase UbiE
MFEKDGPTFIELMKQALQSTKGGYELLATKFNKTPFRTPDVIVEKTVEMIGEKVGASMDLCAGTGAGLVALREKTKDRLVGVDFSPAMLAEAKKALRIPGDLSTVRNPRIELVESDIFNVPYQSEFDVVTCFGAFGHILREDEPRFLALIRKALVPGGRFIFATATKPPFYQPKALIAHGFNGVMRLRNALISPPFIMYYLTFMMPDVERLLRWTGFEVKKHEGLFDAPFESVVVISARRTEPSR